MEEKVSKGRGKLCLAVLSEGISVVSEEIPGITHTTYQNIKTKFKKIRSHLLVYVCVCTCLSGHALFGMVSPLCVCC